MDLLQQIRNDNVLDLWCSVQMQDYRFNMDAIRQALGFYPAGECDHIRKAVDLGYDIASRAIGQANQKAELLLAEANRWKNFLAAAEQ